ncbi:putative beta-carotene-binding protein [Diabrotica undecimpunctata]|uniref:putative beta-carotene-binding protein n=1 Tax=Diabrotica undecimpunctata TaxID=50387 RepID=UPI003B63D3FD
MKYFVFLCLISFCAARQLPKYFNVCKPKETDISKCIKENIEEIRPKLDDGIPEIGIPSINPLKIPFAELNIGKEFKSSMKDINIYGINTFIVKDLKVDLDSNYIVIKVNIPHIHAEGEYNVKGKLLILTLDGSGPGQINITNLEVTLIGHGVREIKHGKTFLKISSIDITPNIGKVNLRLDNLFKNNPELTETSNKVLNENQEVLVEQFAPPIVQIVEVFMSQTISNVFRKYSKDVLFPDN